MKVLQLEFNYGELLGPSQSRELNFLPTVVVLVALQIFV
jgi:hypothetical protein